MNSRIWIIVLNYGSLTNTRECLKSLAELEYDDFCVAVVNNGPVNRLAEVEAKSTLPCAKVKVYDLDQNLGFTGANNLVIRDILAQEKGILGFWLLNNDAIVEPRSLAAMVEVLTDYPSVGIVGSKILYTGAPWLLNHLGGDFSCWTGVARHIGKDEPDRNWPSDPIPVKWVTGCSMLLRTRMLEDVGLLDDRFFAYGEDVDLCLRAAAAGWETRVAPASVVRHKISPNDVSPFKVYLNVRNTLLLVHKHYPCYVPVVALFQSRTILTYGLRMRRFDCVKAVLKAYLHFVFGHYGKPGKSMF